MSSTFLNIKSTLVKGPAEFEPVLSTELLLPLMIDDTPENQSIIAGYIPVAREWIEHEVSSSIVQRTTTVYLDDFPCGDIEIRLPPVQSITSITYLDGSGVSQTLSTSLYRVDLTSKPGRISPEYGQVWPVTYCVNKAVTITAVTGPTSASGVPHVARQAMRILVKSMFDNGGTICDDVRNSVRMMLDSIRWEGSF